MEKILMHDNFERIQDRFEHERGAGVAALCLDLGRVAMHFSRVDRVPRYDDGERENDVEHSYMLALVAPEIAKALELDLEPGLLSQYAIVHDLVELKTGDTATFLFDETSQAQKERVEQAAIDELVRTLPPYTAALLLTYESQQDPEARFVRYVDKLLPLVIDVIGQGTRVMNEDYGVTSDDVLEQCHQALHARLIAKFGGEFPELDNAHKILYELFQTVFSSSPQAS